MKKILTLLLVIITLFSAFIFASCEDDSTSGLPLPSDTTVEELFKNVNMKEVYSIYVDYAEEMDEEVLSFEEWFTLVKGEEFKKGIIPEIQKNLSSDFWEISYNNGKGWNSLRFKTETEEQKNCKHAFKKWITLLDHNEFFNGIRYRECKHCNYKEYDFKLKHKFEIEEIPSTCIEQGYIKYTCNEKGCDYSYTEGLPLAEHTFEGGVCTVCGEGSGEELGHTPYEYFIFTLLDDETYSIAANEAFNLPDELVLPSTYMGKPVTVIESEGFAQSFIKKVIVSDSVIRIKERAFYHCLELSTIDIPDNVLTVEAESFCLCENLSSISIGDGVIHIGVDAFVGCELLITTEENNVKYLSLEENPYFYALSVVKTDIRTVQINENCKFLGNGIFAGCDNVVSVEIPDSVISLGSASFSACSNLESVKFGENTQLKSIESYAFGGCKKLSDIVLPNSVIYIGTTAFEDCDSLNSFKLPDSLLKICERAFWDCDSLTEVVVSKNSQMKRFGIQAFALCSSLESIIIPLGVEIIEPNVFEYCDSLTIYCEAKSQPERWNKQWNISNCPVYWYSETEPTQEGNYWHYVDGVAVKW